MLLLKKVTLSEVFKETVWLRIMIMGLSDGWAAQIKALTYHSERFLITSH